MKKEIILQNTAQGIVSHNLVNGKPDPEMVRLIGTHIVPTAWCSAESMAEAVREISKLNPGAKVTSI